MRVCVCVNFPTPNYQILYTEFKRNRFFFLSLSLAFDVGVCGQDPNRPKNELTIYIYANYANERAPVCVCVRARARVCLATGIIISRTPGTSVSHKNENKK